LIAFETEIKETLTQNFYNSCFKEAYKNITDDDIDWLIKTKKEEIREITSDQYKK